MYLFVRLQSQHMHVFISSPVSDYHVFPSACVRIARAFRYLLKHVTLLSYRTVGTTINCLAENRA